MKLDLKRLIESLDTAAKGYLEKGVQRAIERGGAEILIEDMLYVMLEEERSVLRKLLEQYGIEERKMREALEAGVRMGAPSESTNPVFSSSLIRWMENTYVINKVDLGLDEITELSLIYAMFEYSDHFIATDYFALFREIDPSEVTALLRGFLQEAKETSPAASQALRPDRAGSDLEKYTVDLTRLAKEGKVDPVLSRESEIKQAIDILSRRRKNNPILVGDAGVGKTAVVEGLALKIVNEEVPLHLHNARLLSLDLGAMQAGASIKGEFERRLQAVINEIKASTVFTILFIDEAHTLIGAGGNEGGSDAANLLKPALARGELKTIAATTWLEYRKYFEKDPALSRRFQKIDLHEPSIEQAVTILRGIAEKYEEVHGVYIEDDAILAAVNLSARYITGRKLPDKAIDVLDTACANVKISKSNRPFALQQLENEIKVLEKALCALERDEAQGVKHNGEKIEALKQEIEDLTAELQRKTSLWERQKEQLRQIETLRKAEEKEALAEAYKRLKELGQEGVYIYENVTPEQVAEVISSWTGIPLGSMKKEQAKSVVDLASQIKESVIGQDESIDYLGRFLQISTAGLKKENTPEGVFLLVGPSGVGKTETALKIAETLYGGEKFLTTINMTEFQEKHTVSRLIGSPPGYVGYGEGGQLTDPVRIKPYSVVLLDEIEKAHPDILNLFYQIFDKGTANDGEGREIDFSNTVIIMTSNLATEEITKLCAQDENISMEKITEAITPILSKYLKPALLGRMTIIPYKNLADEALKKIVKLKLSTVEKLVNSKNIGFECDEKVFDYIVSLSNASETGARNLELVINNNIMPKLSKIILQGMVEERKIEKIQVHISEDEGVSVEAVY
ncbi:type VI secretion system ATPase TssH [Hydrogenimonas sp.]